VKLGAQPRSPLNWCMYFFLDSTMQPDRKEGDDHTTHRPAGISSSFPFRCLACD
jgi:hypothetical protein